MDTLPIFPEMKEFYNLFTTTVLKTITLAPKYIQNIRLKR